MRERVGVDASGQHEVYYVCEFIATHEERWLEAITALSHPHKHACYSLA